MAGTFNCPTCGAPLELPGHGETVGKTVRCDYCGNSVIVPEELRSKAPAPSPSSSRDDLTPEQLGEIQRLLRNGQKIEAIKVYRQATLLGLKEAKDAVEAIAAAHPEMRNRPPVNSPSINQRRSTLAVILVALFFFAIASIFPLVFFPMGIDAWQLGEYAGAIVAFAGAVIWALVWGGIGWLIAFSKA